MGLRELVRRRLVLRRFKPWTRPRSMAGDRAEQGIEYLTRTLGPWHSSTVQARFKLRYWLQDEGDLAAALRLGEAEVAHRTADFGPDHADTLAARESLIPTHPDARGLPAALIQARNLTEDMSRVLGPHHPDTLRVRRTLSYCLMDNGKTAEAIQVLTDLLAEVETLTPSRHDELRSVWFRLAVVLERHGDLEKALVYVEKELDAERGASYPVDEEIARHHLKYMQAWRDRLAGRPFHDLGEHQHCFHD